MSKESESVEKFLQTERERLEFFGELIQSDREELIKSQRNKIDALIFFGVVRAKVQLKKAVKAGHAKNSKVEQEFKFYLDDYFLLNRKNPLLPRAKEIHGVPAFKTSCIRELIYQIADDNFWHKYYEGFRHNLVEGSYKARFQEPDMDSAIQQSVIYKFNSAPDIKISKDCYAERSILLRVVYALSGHNPYPEDELKDFEAKIQFEIEMLRLSIKRLEAFHNLIGLQADVVSDYFLFALRDFTELLKNSSEALNGLFILWKKNKGMNHSVWEELPDDFKFLDHDDLIAKAKAEKDAGLQETETMQLLEWSEEVQYEQKFHSLHIEKNLIIKLWGGTLKSFNRIQSDKSAKGEPFVRTYEKSDLFDVSKKNNYIKIQDAIDFLQSKEIDWTLKNEQRLNDFSYKYIAFLEKKISENSADLTMKSAINAIEETSISDSKKEKNINNHPTDLIPTYLDIFFAKIYLPILIEVAKSKKCISYGDLVAKSKALHPNDEQIQKSIPRHVGRRLNYLRQRLNLHNLPDLSSLVINNTTQTTGYSYHLDPTTEQKKVFKCDWNIPNILVV